MDVTRTILLLAVALGTAAPSPMAQTPATSQAPATPQTPATGQAPPKPAAPATTAGKPAGPAAPAAATPEAAPNAPPLSEAYSYDPEGRRDPFVSLLVRGGERSGPEVRPDGREGLLIAEVTLRGIVKSRSSYMAMLQGADNKTYIVHAGDKMLDGVVKIITADAVVFAQDVNDPLSLVKQREIRKALRVTEEGK